MKIQKKELGLLAGILAFILILLFTNLEPGKPEITRTLAIAALMSIWWVSEAVPVAVTALVPIVAIPIKNGIWKITGLLNWQIRDVYKMDEINTLLF